MIRVTTRFTGVPGSPYYNQLYFGGDTPGEADAAAQAARDFWVGCANGINDDVVGVIEQEVEFVDVLTGQVTGVETHTLAPFDGFSTGEALPWSSQGLIKVLTDTFINGRRLRGRVFIPAPTEASSGEGVPLAAYLTILQDGIDNMLAAAGGAGGWVVYSPTHRIQGGVTSAIPWATNWAVLRSRRD